MSTSLTAPSEAQQLEITKAHQELERLMDSGMGSSTHDMRVAAAFMEWARAKHILLTPVTGAIRMRDGWELAFSKIRISTDKLAKEVYKVSGNDDDDSRGFGDNTELGFHKTALYKLARNLGINITGETRTDDRRDANVCEFEASGWFMDIDGTPKPLTGTGSVDLRADTGNGEPSGRVKKIRREAKSPASAERKIEMQRDKIVQLAATNACERLIVSYGLRSSYTKKELDEKFIICVRPIFTGYSEDPAIRLMFAQETAKQMSGSVTALYGAQPPAQIAAPQTNLPALNAAESETTQSDGPTSTAPPPAWVVPFGKHRDKPVNDPSITPADLAGMKGYCEMALDDENQKAHWDTIKGYQMEIEAEISRRAAPKVDDQPPGGMLL